MLEVEVFGEVRGVKLLELRKHNLSGSSTEYPYELRDTICPQLLLDPAVIGSSLFLLPLEPDISSVLSFVSMTEHISQGPLSRRGGCIILAVSYRVIH
jgi:hypothetical protein